MLVSHSEQISKQINSKVSGFMGFPGGASAEELACQCWRCKGLRLDPWIGMIPWKRGWDPTPVSLPGESQGQRSLVDDSPQGRKELDTAEAT